MTSLDRTDARILLALDATPRSSVLRLAEDLGLARSTVSARLERLYDAGVVGSPSTTVDPALLGFPILGFVALSVDQRHIRDIYEQIGAVPEVVELYTLTGPADLHARVVARDTADLHRVTQRLQSITGVSRSSTVVATTEVISRRTSQLLSADAS